MSDVSELFVRFYVNGEDRGLSVRKLSGTESISELFRFEIELHGDDAEIDFDAGVGMPAHVTVTWGEATRHFDGIISVFEELETSEEGARYRAELVPAASLLDVGPASRVFAEITIPELISRVLAEHGITDVRLSLAETYAQRDVVVQYRETDWALLSRWMEAEGIHCWFEHGERGHTLVVSDAPTTHDDLDGGAALRYRKEALDAGESVLSFELAQRIVPARVAVRDYPFSDPRSTNEETAEAAGGGTGDVYDFPASGAQKRLDAARLSKRKGRGTASTVRLAPAHILELEGHARASYNDRWLLTAVSHAAELADGAQWSYKATFECFPATASYRPPRSSPWPRILGAQMATIAGPSGSEIHTDENGRALVVFHWDRGPSGAGTAIWVPLSQIAASQGFGAVHLPRVGDAVLVEFLDGDPDRPVVTGRLYHKVNVHPYTLPGNRTKTVFRDASSPGGEGYNELSFDSAKGAEEVYLRAQRDSRIEVQNDAKRSVGNDDTLSVDGARTVSVGGANTRTVGGDETISVTGSQSVSVETNQTISITGDRKIGVGGDLVEQVEGDRTTAVAGDDDLEITGDRSVSVAGSRSTEITGDDYISVSGSRAESIEGDRQVIVDGQTFESHGSLYVSVTGETSMSYGGDLKVESSTIQKLGAPKIYIAAGTKLYLRALESITLEVGDSTLTVEDGKVTVTNGGATKTLSGDTIYMNT